MDGETKFTLLEPDLNFDILFCIIKTGPDLIGSPLEPNLTFDI